MYSHISSERQQQGSVFIVTIHMMYLYLIITSSYKKFDWVSFIGCVICVIDGCGVDEILRIRVPTSCTTAAPPRSYDTSIIWLGPSSSTTTWTTCTLRTAILTLTQVFKWMSTTTISCNFPSFCPFWRRVYRSTELHHNYAIQPRTCPILQATHLVQDPCWYDNECVCHWSWFLCCQVTFAIFLRLRNSTPAQRKFATARVL